jgi:Fe-S-cluster-containing dehydrogenase component/CRP-like cAMP-binding protein
MDPAGLQELLQQPLFAAMDPTAFPQRLPLAGILAHDARVVDFDDGDIILREGDYGSSAFLILSGQVGVVLKSLPARLLGRSEPRRRSIAAAVRQWWNRSSVPEARDERISRHQGREIGSRRGRDGQLRIFLQDIPRIVGPQEIESMSAGELFGEMAALTRSPRSATVISQGGTRLLEIRWQGLRDLMKYSPQLKQYTAQQYREHSLKVHLRETELLHQVDDEGLESIAARTQFLSFGEFQWQPSFQDSRQQENGRQIDSEPIIAQQGERVTGLYLIRSGFVRVSRRRGDGHQTMTYLGKGDYFGFSEILQQSQQTATVPWQYSFRALGYVDLLQIATEDAIQYILPNWPDSAVGLRRSLTRTTQLAHALPHPDLRSDQRVALEMVEPWARGLHAGTANMAEQQSRLEEIVQQRLINGEQAMLIDLDRCTRCDDCVRACADAHDGNPRFLRTGPIIGHHMVAHACMHCTDPVCLIGCPTGAIGREHATGVVQINDDTCIGCGTCAQSCPYDNIRMVEIFDRQFRQQVDGQQLPILKATKCDLCVENNGGPACQNACPHDALVRINMRETDVLSQWLDR